MESEGTKVVFALERDDEDWPPVAAESAWATPLGEDRYRLDNVPWFARRFAYGDVVAAEPDEEGVLYVREQLVWSGRYTVRVIPFGDESAEAQLQAVIEEFASLGAECESALPSFTLIALDIPPTARVAEIKGLLVEGEAAGRWGYEEGCIDDRWTAL